MNTQATTSREAGISKALLGWYRTNRRRLPWRENPEPYRVWVSEIMLQQTRVETVIPYFERFLERFLLLIGQIATEFVPRDVGIVTQRDGGPNADALDAGKTHRYLA